MRQISHPNILRLESSFVHISNIYMVHQLIRYGSCKDAMDRFLIVGFPEMIVSLISKDILMAIDYLHKKGYVHRSIRASHILLDDRAMLTGFKECVNLISDGKRAKRLHSLPQSPKELIWMAPEVLEQNLLGYTEKSDIYSFGITLCELGNNLTPFAEMDNTFMLTEKIKGNQPQLIDASTYLDIPMENTMEGFNREEIERHAQATKQFYATRKFSDPFHEFVKISLQRDSLNRPSAEKLLSHPFIKQSKYTSLRQELGELKLDPINVIFSTPEIGAEAISNAMSEMNIDCQEDFEWVF